MANFRTHLTTAAVASSGLAAFGLYAEFYGLTTAVLCAIIGTLGGLLPDIDLDHSKPAKQGFLIASLFASALITILFANRYQGERLILDSLLVWGVGFLVMRFGVLDTFSRLTIHRGMVHSVPYMALFALGLVCAGFYGLKLTAFSSWIFGGFLFFGSLIHLILDEIYSIDVFGLKLKKSSGTAFKFIEKNKPIGYACLYALVFGLFYLAPPYHDVLATLIQLDIMTGF